MSAQHLRPQPGPGAGERPPRERLIPTPGTESARRRQVAATVSIVLHGLALGYLLWTAAVPQGEQSEDPAVQIVYQGTAPSPSTSAAEADDMAPQQRQEEPSAPEPAPVPPTPDTSTPPPPAPEAPVPEPLIPEPTPPALPEPLPPPEPDAPPAPATAAPTLAPEPDAAPGLRSVPTVRLTAPESDAPKPLVAPFVPPSFAPPSLAPAEPPPPRPAPARPPRLVQQAQRPAARPRFADGFGPPIDLNFAPSTPPQSDQRPRLGANTRAVDLSLGTPKAGPNRSEAFFDARAAKIGADWASGLAAYWRIHRFYPRQAIENGDDGTVKVEITVNRQGKVESVEVVGKSGSPWLDMAALSTWRGAQLAPFPAENTEQRITTTLTINYILLR